MENLLSKVRIKMTGNAMKLAISHKVRALSLVPSHLVIPIRVAVSLSASYGEARDATASGL